MSAGEKLLKTGPCLEIILVKFLDALENRKLCCFTVRNTKHYLQREENQTSLEPLISRAKY